MANIKMTFYYGMRLRGFSPFCQPKDGLIGRATGNVNFASERFRQYKDVIAYDRELSVNELDGYDLDYLGCEYHSEVRE